MHIFHKWDYLNRGIEEFRTCRVCGKTQTYLCVYDWCWWHKVSSEVGDEIKKTIKLICDYKKRELH